MEDPLVQILVALQKTSNDVDQKAPENWSSINQRLLALGAPTLGNSDKEASDAFGRRYDADPAIQELVDHFDEHGLVVKNNRSEPSSTIGGDNPMHSMMQQAAKHATQLGK